MKNWHKFLMLLLSCVGYELFSSEASSNWFQRTLSTYSSISDPLLQHNYTYERSLSEQFEAVVDVHQKEKISEAPPA